MQFAGGGKVALLAELDDLCHLGRRFVRRHRNDSLASDRHHGNRHWIVAAQHDEILARTGDDLGHLRKVGVFLDADNVPHLGKTKRRLRGQVHTGPTRNVVEHDRQRRRLGNRLEMLIEPFLGRLVVVRRHRQQPVGPDAFHVARKLDRFPGVVATGTGQDRYLAVGFLEHQFHHAQLVAMRQRRRFSRRAARRQEMHAAVDLPSRQALDRCLIEGAVASERRDECSPNTCKWSTHDDLRLSVPHAGLKTRSTSFLAAYCLRRENVLHVEPASAALDPSRRQQRTGRETATIARAMNQLDRIRCAVESNGVRARDCTCSGR